MRASNTRSSVLQGLFFGSIRIQTRSDLPGVGVALSAETPRIRPLALGEANTG